MRFFTSDLHLGHARINELAGRPFDSTYEMNYELVDNWNNIVAPGDQVFILGDLAMGKLTDTLSDWVAQLNGFKVLICGNHDRPFIGNSAKERAKARLYHDAGIDVILPGEPTFVNVGGFVLPACHFPYEGDSQYEDRYDEFRPIDNGDVLIHGHVHESWKMSGRQVNVGTDVWRFTPVMEDELYELVKGVV